MKCNYCPKNLRGRSFTTNGAFCSLCGDSVFSLKFPANCSNISHDKIKIDDLVFNIPNITSKFDLDFFIPISVLKTNSAENINISCDDITAKGLIDVSKCSFYLDLPGYNKTFAINIKLVLNPNNGFFRLSGMFKDFFSFIKKYAISSSYFTGKFKIFFSQRFIEKDVHFFIFNSWPPITAIPFPNKQDLDFWYQDIVKKTVTVALLLKTNNQHSVYLRKIGNSNELCNIFLRIADKQFIGKSKPGYKLIQNLTKNKSYNLVFEFDISSVKASDLTKEQNKSCSLALDILGCPQQLGILDLSNVGINFKGPISFKFEPNAVKKYQLFHRESLTCNFEFKVQIENKTASSFTKDIKFGIMCLYLALPSEVTDNDFKNSITDCFEISDYKIATLCDKKVFSIALNTKNLNKNCIGKFFSVIAKCITPDLTCRFVELFQVDINQYQPFNSDLAIDFGTSNSCIVDRIGIDNSQAKTLNLKTVIKGENYTSEDVNGIIPTVIYFEDVSDPDNPQYRIGTEAQLILRRGKGLIRFFKRNFVENTEFLITDDNGIKHTYKAEKLVVFFITRMLEMAEHFSKKYVVSFSASFPTKWPKQASTRLADVLKQVSERLFKINGGLILPKVISPKLDEASACILSIISNKEFVSNFKEKGSLLVGSIDIGGGTTDTTLVKVTYTPKNDEIFQFDFIGFGGFSDFGGTDITGRLASVLSKKLHNKIKELFPPDSAIQFVFLDKWYDEYNINYDSTNTNLSQIILDEQKEFNSNILFDLAEKLKIEESDILRLSAILSAIEDLKVLKIEDSKPDNTEDLMIKKSYSFISLQKINDKQDNFDNILASECNVKMQDVFDVKFNKFPNISMHMYSINEIIQSIAKQMKHQISLISDNPLIKIDKLIIAGGASSDKFINDTILNTLVLENNDAIPRDSINPKFHVSFGLSWYLEQLKDSFFESLDFSIGLLHNTIARNRIGIYGNQIVMFSAGSSNNNLKFSFKITSNMIKSREKSLKPIRVILICWSIEGESPMEFGVFEFQNNNFEDLVDKVLTGLDLNATIFLHPSDGVFSLTIEGALERQIQLTPSNNYKEACRLSNIDV